MDEHILMKLHTPVTLYLSHLVFYKLGEILFGDSFIAKQEKGRQKNTRKCMVLKKF